MQAVIFDLDNTLYDYDVCNEAAEKKLFQVIAQKFSCDESFAEKMFRKARKTVKENLLPSYPSAHNRMLYMHTLCELFQKNPVTFAPLFYRTYWQTFLNEMKLFSYVLPLLTALKKEKIKLAICTDLTTHIQLKKLKKLKLEKFFDVIVTSEAVGFDKPSEKMFSCVLKKLAVAKEDALFVGDDEKKDFYGAKNFGMRAILFTRQKNFEKVILREIKHCCSVL